MNARAHSITTVGSATSVRRAPVKSRKDAGDLQAAVGILTGVAVSVAFWVVIALIIL